MTTSSLTLQSTLSLQDRPSVKLPILGFGVYQSPGEQCTKSCLVALKAGYRHIDTAQYYANESQVGEAVRQSGLKREEVFITSKILDAGSDEQSTYESVLSSVEAIDPGENGYLDLMLIHTPSGGTAANKLMWGAMERAQKEGRIKAIGVSNFGIGHIKELLSYSTTGKPLVNQIELHPWCQQRDLVKYCQDNGIVVEAYCPLVRNQKADNKALVEVAEKYKKNTAHILIRYCIQKGWSPLPKSDTPSRIEANAQVFGWSMSDEDMAKLDSLDEGPKGAICEYVDNS